jgi:hypothetical protein
MSMFNLPCVYCKRQLIDVGVLLQTTYEFFVYCEVCMGLYYIDVLQSVDSNKPLIVVQPCKMDIEEELYIIDKALNKTRLSEYLTQNQDQEQQFPSKEQKNADIKELIESSVTPTDLIRKLRE